MKIILISAWLHRSLDGHLLRHLVEFLKEIAKRPNTKEVFRKYDFHSGILATMMVSCYRIQHIHFDVKILFNATILDFGL